MLDNMGSRNKKVLGEHKHKPNEQEISIESHR